MPFSSPSFSRSLLRPGVLLAGVLTLTAVLYLPLLFADFLTFDDLHYILENPHVNTGLTAANLLWAFTHHLVRHEPAAEYWAPMLMLSRQLDCTVFGLWGGGHHLSSVLLHLLNGWLVYRLLAKLTSLRWPAVAVAAVFLLHPVNVETVAWISGRKDVLTVTFALLCFLAYERYARTPSLSRYLLMIAAYACGLASKPSFVTVFAILWVLDFWPMQRWSFQEPSRYARPGVATLLAEKLPLILLSALVGFINIVVVREVGSLNDLTSFPLSLRLAHVGESAWEYFRMLLWPTNLYLFYPLPEPPIPIWPGIFGLAGLTVLSLLILSQAKRVPALLGGWLWFAIAWFPSSGISQTGGQDVADRYMYLPMIGLTMGLAYGANALLGRRQGERAPARRWLLAIPMVWMGAMSIITANQVPFWQSTETIFQRTLDKDPDNYLAHISLATRAWMKGDYTVAEKGLQRVLQIKPDWDRGNYSMAVLLCEQGRHAEAVPFFHRAISNRPGWPLPWIRLGFAMLDLKDPKRAETAFLEAIRLDGSSEQPWFGLARAALASNNLPLAQRALAQAAALAPQDPILQDLQMDLEQATRSASPP